MLADLLGGRKISPDDVLRAAGEIFGGFPAGHPAGGPGVHPGTGGARVPHGWPVTPPTGYERQRRRPPPPPPAELELQRELARARMELGFEHRAPLTVDDVEKRRKELARKHHPDLGGNPERMVRINQAADLLVAKGDLG